MTIYGYARVSTDGQTLAAQDVALYAAGCVKVYGEKQSGANAGHCCCVWRGARASTWRKARWFGSCGYSRYPLESLPHVRTP
jgi:hypothetical protein